MTPNNNSNRLHPLIATAACSVILVSLVGVAAITGMLPDSRGSTAPLAGLSENTLDVGDAVKATSDDAPLASQLTADKLAEEPVKQASISPPAPKPQPVRQAKSQPAIQPITRPAPYQPAVATRAPTCHSCGRVESVYAVAGSGNSGIGVAAGTVVGGLLGNKIGKGNGRKVATVAGAIGGSLAGLEVERRISTSYEVRVRMEDGQVRTFPYDNQPAWQSGDRIRVVNGYLTAQG